MYPVISDELGNSVCSNRQNDLLIFTALTWARDRCFMTLSGTSLMRSQKNPFVSLGNDKCPSLYGDYLVFASDREGGYGGFDLYYSRYENA